MAYTADCYVKKTARQLRNAASSFHRECEALRAEQQREERERVAEFVARMAPLRKEARAIVDSAEARPWLKEMAKKAGISLPEARSFMRVKAVSDPERIIEWAQQRREKAA